MGKELSSHWHSGRERKKLKRKVVWGLRKGHDRLSNFWVYCSHQHSSELTSNYLDECAYAGVHVNEYVCVVDCVPQWCWGQQCPGMAVWTRERPGAQLTDDWGHRLTSQTAIKGTKYEYYLKVRQKHTHTHTRACSCSLPQWYCGQQLLVVFRSTARISPFEQVGMGSIHDSHTAQRENKQEHSQIYCCN